MRQAQKELTDKIVMVQEVHEGAYDFKIINPLVRYSVDWGTDYEEICKYEFISTHKEMTEDKVKMVVEEWPKDSGYYIDYDDEDIAVKDTALESYSSLLKSMGINTVNPFGERPSYPRYLTNSVNVDLKIMNDYKSDLAQWEAAEKELWRNFVLLINKK